ncbi:MAG: bifunctional hydroxymethylpyrimidine kinase/phosphomethylpyrimidine kinase [Myxococcales bacterium]|nr:bifunctional hydroxymethylpyrimidine kinase/phosphomethylpyrimidine kinase [Myxococcales bacterium]
MSVEKPKPIALTIAGADSSGGAGVYADLKTFAAWGVHGTAVITAVTAQNSLTCDGTHPIPGHMIQQQLNTLFSDMPAAHCKIGMLANEDVVSQVTQSLTQHQPRIVYDPVIQSSTGAALLSEPGVQAMKAQLLPQVYLLTPNLPEAEALCGLTLNTPQHQKDACARLVDMGATNVLLKGGHLNGDPVDVLYDGTHYFEMKANRQHTSNTHGTGCVLSAAITAALTLGHELPQAVMHAHAFVQKAIFSGYACGQGDGPINPLFAHPSGASHS